MQMSKLDIAFIPINQLCKIFLCEQCYQYDHCTNVIIVTSVTHVISVPNVIYVTKIHNIANVTIIINVANIKNLA